MKARNVFLGVLAFVSFGAISTAVIAARTSAPDIGYYSDAAMTNMVGEITYGCYGGHTSWGDTSTPYSKTLFVVNCTTGTSSSGTPSVGTSTNSTTYCSLQNPFNKYDTTLNCYTP